MCFGAGSMQNEMSAQNSAAAGQLRNQAEGMYGGLSQAGGNVAAAGQQYQQYNNLLDTLLPQYESAAGIAASGPQMTNPYRLTAAQQQQLNSQIDAINRRQQSDAAALQAHAATQGINDPAHYQAALQNLNQAYGQMVADHTANFYENARQSALSNINNLMGFGAQQKGAGMQTQLGGLGLQENAAGGIAGLAGGAQAAANAQAQTALQQQQAANSFWGGLINDASALGGFALNSGFNKRGAGNAGSGNSGNGNRGGWGNDYGDAINQQITDAMAQQPTNPSTDSIFQLNPWADPWTPASPQDM